MLAASKRGFRYTRFRNESILAQVHPRHAEGHSRGSGGRDGEVGDGEVGAAVLHPDHHLLDHPVPVAVLVLVAVLSGNKC